MFQFNIIIYITIFLSTIIGCDCNRLSKISFTNSNQGNGKPIIVLLHGLGSYASAFDYLASELKLSFPGVDVVALENETFLASIKEQAAKAFDELSEKIPDLQNRPILLIGHSQGGLRAYTMFDTYKHALNVKGIITIGTPWEGAPALNADHKRILTRLQDVDVMHEMEILSRACGKDANWLQGKLIREVNGFQLGDDGPGVSDLKPGSEFLGWVQDRLPSVNVPILFIGGEGSNFKVFELGESNNDFKVLHNLWTKVIVGQTHHNKKHDMVVPLYSALAANIVPAYHKNFKRVTIPDAIHCELLKLPDEKVSKELLHHPEMVNQVIAFGTRVFGDRVKMEQPQKAAKAA